MLALLQFDSASVPLLNQMLQGGQLPILSSLRERGRWLELGAETYLFEAAHFPSLYSGVEVGDHGLYAAFPWSPKEQRIRFMYDFALPSAAWERLARAGKRSLVIDPYQVWPPKDMSGVFMSGWQLDNRMVLPRFSSPAGMMKDLGRYLGPPPPGELVFGLPSVADLTLQRKTLLEAPQRITDAVLHLLTREAFDLLWVGFTCVHLAGHGLWELSSSVRRAVDASTRQLLETAVADVYKAVDAAIGRILDALSPDTDLIVFSPDGMGPDTSGSDMLPDMLGAVLHAGAPGSKAPRAAPGSTLWRLRAVLPARYRATAARWFGDTSARDLAARLYFAGLDWAKTRAFAVQGDFYGFVRLNLRGRERNGIVEPGPEAEALLDQIIEGLATFRDPDGAPCISTVERVPQSIRRGPYGDRLPDLVVCWSQRPRAGVRELHSAQFGRVTRRGAGTGLAGNHSEGGWAIVVPAASRVRTTSRPPRIVDIPATACTLLGADTMGLAGESLLEPA